METFTDPTLCDIFVFSTFHLLRVMFKVKKLFKLLCLKKKSANGFLIRQG